MKISKTKKKKEQLSSFTGRPLTAYASSPHLFVFQTDEVCEQDEPIYSSASDVQKSPEFSDKDAIKAITEKYDSLKKLSERAHSVDYLDTRYEPEENSDSSLRLTDDEVVQIQTSFSGYKTQVYVGTSLVNLYFSQAGGEWELKYSGVPLLLLECGDTKNRTKRQLQIVLAEKGSGFLLWTDVIDNLSGYKAPNGTFHTMYLSADHRQMIGLSFDDEEAAQQFLDHVEHLTSNPENISLSAPTKKKKLKKVKSERTRKPQKSEISSPCHFQHVTRVEARDNLYSLQAFTPEPVHIVTKL